VEVAVEGMKRADAVRQLEWAVEVLKRSGGDPQEVQDLERAVRRVKERPAPAAPASR
jgi:hypothetical protein